MWFIYVVGIIIVLVINYIIAKQFEAIAKMKGHAGNVYFWFTFFFGVVGMLMVIALPVQTENKHSGAADVPVTQSSAKETVYTAAATPQVWGNNDNKKTQYRCGNCGQAGPYHGHCPSCGSSIRVYNN